MAGLDEKKSPVFCGACGVYIGETGMHRGRSWLFIGSMRVYSLHGYCKSCGAVFHFSTPAHTLETLENITKDNN